MLYGTCRQTRKLGTGGLSYLSKIIFLTKRKRRGISNQRLLAPEPSPYPHDLRSSKAPGRAGPKCHFLCPLRSSCLSVSLAMWYPLYVSPCTSFISLSAFVHPFLPSVHKSWIQELPAQADDCSGKYRNSQDRGLTGPAWVRSCPWFNL